MVGFVVFAILSLALFPFVGRDFFPNVDAGPAPTARAVPAQHAAREHGGLLPAIEDYIRQVIPADEIDVISDNIGVPNSINLALSDSVTVGPSDGEILVALNGAITTRPRLPRTLRRELPRRFPELTFFTQPADIVSQILNFGLPAPIDIQISGPIQESDKNYEIARAAREGAGRRARCGGRALQQIVDAPRIMVNTDRGRSTRAA